MDRLVSAVVVVLTAWTGTVGAADAPREATPAATAAVTVPAPDSPTDQDIARWTAALAQGSGDDKAWVSLGDALMQKARETADAGYYARAEDNYRKALVLNAKNTGALTGLAQVAGSRHEFEQSSDWARQALGLEPDNAQAFGLLGDAALEMGNYDTAYEHYQKMLNLRPDPSSYSRGAYLLYLIGDVRKATWLMRRAIAAGAPYAESTAWYHEQLALMHWNNGALLAAEQVLEQGLELSPRNHRLLGAMGKIKASKRDYPAAIDYYQRANAIAAEPDAVIALGDVYAIAGQAAEAAKHYARLEAMHAENKANGVRDDLVMARFYADHDRNPPEALKQAESVWETRKNIFVADTLAWCLYQSGRYEDAKKAIQAALRLGTPDANIRFHAGMIYAKAGDRQTGRRYLFEALSLNGNFHPRYATVAADTLKALANRAPTAASVGGPP